jgi:tetratricopeptide (TPR) repeat protein
MDNLDGHLLSCITAYLLELSVRQPNRAEDFRVASEAVLAASGFDGRQRKFAQDTESQLGLREIFSLGMVSKYRLLSSTEGSEAEVREAAESQFVLESDRKWQQFLQQLGKQGFFDGLEMGTPEYKERFAMAEEKFKTKFGLTDLPAAASMKAKFEATEAEHKERAEKKKVEGNNHMREGKHAAAAASYAEAIALDPKNAVYFANRAAALMGMGEYEEALEDANEAISLDPQYVKAYNRAAAALLQLGDAEGALERYEDSLALDPTSDVALDGATRCRRQLGKHATQATGSVAAGEAAARNAGARDAHMTSSTSSPAGGAAGGASPMDGLDPSMLGGLDPSMLSAAMNNPQFAQMAQSVMSNPDLMASMMRQFGMGGQ